MKRPPGAPELGPAPERRTILVIGDEPVARFGLSSLIAQQSDLAICGEAASAQAALELLSNLSPDLAVVDLVLGTMGGVEALKGIRAARPHMRVLVMSLREEDLYAERALRAGAAGYIMRNRPVAELLAAMRSVLAGEVYLSERMKGRMLSRMAAGPEGGKLSAIETLTDREMEVFRLIGNGYGTRQIAERLHLSSKTIESHREHLKRKLGLAGGSDLVLNAVEWARSD